MTDLAIRQCALVIRRPAGTAAPWLDGDDHRAVARRVQAIVLPMLEELLAPRLRDRPGAQDLPLEIDLTLAARDLAGAAPLARPHLRARLADAVEAALAAAELNAPRALQARAAQERDAAPVPHEGPETMPAPPAAHVLRVLKRLFAGGAQAGAISLLSLPTLAALLEQVLDALPPGPSAAPRIAATHREPASSAHARGGRDAPRAALVAALEALATALSAARRSAAEAQPVADMKALRAQAERALAEAARGPARARDGHKPSPERPAERARLAGTETARPRVADPSRPEGPRHRPIDDASTGSVTGLAPGRHDLDSALPFLALAVLARHGIADAMTLDMPDPASCRTLAAGVALKALPCGPTGWNAGDLRSSAQAVGLGTAPDGAAFAAAAARLSSGGACCRAVAAAALLGSLDTHGTLPLVEHRDQIVLFDPGGLYPVACGTVPALISLLRATRRTFFLAPADPGVWHALDAAGLPVIAEGPALPAERAAPVAGPGGWRGRATPATRLSRGLRARLPVDAAQAMRATEVWHALDAGAPLTRHPADRDRMHALSDLATLLAGFALADIGWNLFGHDPASWAEPDPLLVRKRFADLSGWLEVGSRRITVILPLGRRALDLRDAGLLDTVGVLPWFPGRDVAFRAG